MTAGNNYKKIVLEIQMPAPSVELADRICERINRARLIQGRIYISIHSGIIIGSIILFIPIFNYTHAAAGTSGFYQYMSLIISDGTYLATSWKEMLLPILESAPIAGAALTVGTLFILANSIRKGARYARPNSLMLALRQ